MQTTKLDRRSGRATIVLKDRRVYIADHTELSRHRLTFTGRLRVRDLSGERFYPTRTITVTLGKVRSIHWHRERGGQR
jgi:hypothetical protein